MSESGSVTRTFIARVSLFSMKASRGPRPRAASMSCGARLGGGLLELALGQHHRVLHQHRDGHRSDAPGHGRDVRGPLSRDLELDVAHELVAHPVDSDV